MTSTALRGPSRLLATAALASLVACADGATTATPTDRPADLNRIAFNCTGSVSARRVTCQAPPRFDANGVLIGRTPAPDTADMTQHEAVSDALGMLDLPVVLDVEIGHLQPFLPLVNGAVAHVVIDGERREITQTFA